ncbi:MAG: HAMP domain-containing sensor histidine kinase [Solirubrobacteraceae bacterium]
MTRPRGLRARITLAAVVAVAVVGAVAAVVLLAEVARDGRTATDRALARRVASIERRPPGLPPGGAPPGGPAGAPGLLAGSGTFVQVAYRGQVVQQRGDVPVDAPGVPARNGFRTVQIGGEKWRSLTAPLAQGGGLRVEVLSSLAPVEARVDRIRELVIVLGLAALALTGLAAWAATTLALRPLERLREGAARVSGAEDLDAGLPEDDGPDEVRSLAHALNEMLERLRESTGALERALLATRRFAADAGHELRTPLTSIRANLDVLERNPAMTPGERSALLRETAAEQERITHLLEGLQALARGEAAESLPRERVEIGDLVDAAVHAAGRRHPGTGYALEDGIGDAAVDGWPSGLRLIIDNLLDNAALHGRGGGRALVALDREGGSIVLRVDDDGPGVPEGERAAVLEPFARGPGVRAPGSGLGLAIVAQQVALHGGVLRLGDSALGGLGVEVRLPADPSR